MQQADPRLGALGIRVLVVTFEDPGAADAYREETGVHWPILIDDSRELYDAYGLGRARLHHLIGPTTLVAYAKEALLGQFPSWPVADTTQQGGDVLIDPAGIVRFHHVGAGSGYRPDLEQMLETQRAMDGQAIDEDRTNR